MENFGEKTIESLFDQAGAIKKGHFVLKSGHHSVEYWEKAIAFQFPRVVDELGRRLARLVEHLRPSVLIAPPVGGVLIAQAAARQLDCRTIFMEAREGGPFRLGRGYSVQTSDRCVLVDDICSTGHTLVAMLNETSRLGISPLACAIVVDRRPGTSAEDVASVPIEVFALFEKTSPPNHLPMDCPACRAGLPLINSRDQNVVFQADR